MPHLSLSTNGCGNSTDLTASPTGLSPRTTTRAMFHSGLKRLEMSTSRNTLAAELHLHVVVAGDVGLDRENPVAVEVGAGAEDEVGRRLGVGEGARRQARRRKRNRRAGKAGDQRAKAARRYA